MRFTGAARAALIACVLAAGAAASAQPIGDDWHHGGPGGGEMAFLRGLHLTEAQKQQAHAILKDAFARGRPAMEQMHALQEQKITLLLTAGSTAAQIEPIVKQEESLHSQMEARHLQLALQLRALLTPAQLAQAADLHGKLEALHAQERATLEGTE